MRQGIRGLLVPDERGYAVVYMLYEPSTHYYRVMIRSDRMPVLIGEDLEQLQRNRRTIPIRIRTETAAASEQ